MLPEDIVLGHGIHPRVDMVTMMEKARRMRQVEKLEISQIIQLVGALIPSLYVKCTRPRTFSFSQVEVMIG